MYLTGGLVARRAESVVGVRGEYAGRIGEAERDCVVGEPGE